MLMACYRMQSNIASPIPFTITAGSGLQLLAMANRVDEADRTTVSFIANLQCADGSFSGVPGGESDTRFVLAGQPGRIFFIRSKG